MGPLAGLKILDFSTLLPGPYASQILADLGATVLRIESPTRPDLVHALPPFIGRASSANASLNRNKRSLALNLKHPLASRIIERLLEDYDIVIEQFRPGVMSRLGLGYNQLKHFRPDIIYCSITGYGQTGPMKDRAGHDINYLAVSGLASYSGRSDTGPVLSGTQIADIAGGSHHAVMGILAAVIHRTASGSGQHIDISMTDAALSLTTIVGATALAGGKTPELGTEMLNGGIFYDYYRTADGRYLSVGGLEPQFYSAMLELMDLDEWIPRASDYNPQNQARLKAALKTAFAGKSAGEWLELFACADVCVELVQTIDEAHRSELFLQRGMFVELPTGNGNTVTQVASAIAMSETPASYRSIGPLPGRDSKLVLSELGYSDQEIAAMIADGLTAEAQ